MTRSKNIIWSAWLIASIFYAYQYILRVMPNIMLTDIIQQFNIDAAIFGQFSGAYYIGYCVMHVPIGIMLDRYGPRKIMCLCVLLTAIGLLPIMFAKHWIYPVIGRVFIGAGSSAAILGAFKIIRMTFNERQFTKMLSISVTIGLIGAIYGGVPVSYFCTVYSHKVVVGFFAILGIVFASITYWLVPEQQSSKTTTTIFLDIKEVFTNPKVMLVCFLSGLMVGPMEGFADAWGSEFLKSAYNFDATTANYLTSMLYIGMCFAPVLSRIAEKTGAYYKTTVGAGVVMLLVFVLLMLKTLNFSSMVVGLFLVGLCCAYQILVIYKASTYVHESITGLTTAVANMIIMSFGYVFHSSIGLIIKLYGGVGNADAFMYGISIIPITLFIGSIGFMVLSVREREVKLISARSVASSKV